MAAVMIGVDPAKRSHAMAVLDERETPAGGAAGRQRQRRLPGHAPDGAAVAAADLGGRGRRRRGCSSRSGWSPTVRRRSTCRRSSRPGPGSSTSGTAARTTRATPARSRWSRSAPRACGRCVPDDEMVALRLMSERRRDLVRSRTQTVNHLHQLLMELIPAGAQRNLTAKQGQGAAGDGPAPRRRRPDPAAARRRPGRGPGRAGPQAQGAGQATQGRGRRDRDDPDRHQGRRDRDRGDDPRRGRRRRAGSRPGTTSPPTPASPRSRCPRGEVKRHRLSRAGNRQLNHALHIIALSNKRYDPRGRDYYAKKLAAGKGKKGALRCLKRRLSDSVYRHLLDDQQQRAQRSPGGHLGATLQSSAAGSHPNTGTSEQPLPGSQATLRRGLAAAS